MKKLIATIDRAQLYREFEAAGVRVSAMKTVVGGVPAKLIKEL